jgi:hypothetical protein
VYPEDRQPAEAPKFHRKVVGGYYASPTGQSLRCSELKEQWGEPSSTAASGNRTTLTYRHDLIWAGIVAMLVLPIPLALPIGRKRTTIECADDVIVKASGTQTGSSAAYCGLISTLPQWGCKTE